MRMKVKRNKKFKESLKGMKFVSDESYRCPKCFKKFGSNDFFVNKGHCDVCGTALRPFFKTYKSNKINEDKRKKERRLKEANYAIDYMLPIVGGGSQILNISYHPENEKTISKLMKDLFKMGDFTIKRDGDLIMVGKSGKITKEYEPDPALKPETDVAPSKYGINVDLPFPLSDISTGGKFRITPDDEAKISKVMGTMSKKFGRAIDVKKEGETIFAHDGSEVTVPYSRAEEEEVPEEVEEPEVELEPARGEAGERVSFIHEREGEIPGVIIDEEPDEHGRIVIHTDFGDTFKVMPDKVSKSDKPPTEEIKEVAKKAKGGLLKKATRKLKKVVGKKKYIKRFKKAGKWHYVYPERFGKENAQFLHEVKGAGAYFDTGPSEETENPVEDKEYEQKYQFRVGNPFSSFFVRPDRNRKDPYAFIVKSEPEDMMEGYKEFKKGDKVRVGFKKATIVSAAPKKLVGPGQYEKSYSVRDESGNVYDVLESKIKKEGFIEEPSRQADPWGFSTRARKKRYIQPNTEPKGMNESVEDDLVQFLKENPNPSDDELHNWAEEKGHNVEEVEATAYKLATQHVQRHMEQFRDKEDALAWAKGERRKGKSLNSIERKLMASLKDIDEIDWIMSRVTESLKEYVQPIPESAADPTELAMGVEVEAEHTDNPEEAKKIALQHLAELPDYYTKLKKMEAGKEQLVPWSTFAAGKGVLRKRKRKRKEAVAVCPEHKVPLERGGIIFNISTLRCPVDEKRYYIGADGNLYNLDTFGMQNKEFKEEIKKMLPGFGERDLKIDDIKDVKGKPIKEYGVKGMKKGIKKWLGKPKKAPKPKKPKDTTQADIMKLYQFKQLAGR